MKAMVLSVSKNAAVVVTETGEFRRVPGSPDYAVGSEVDLVLASPARLRWHKPAVLVAAAATVILAITVSQLQSVFAAPVAYASLDIQPSVVLGLSAQGIVLSESGQNSDGARLVAADNVVGKDVVTATSSLVQEAFTKQLVPSTSEVTVVMATYAAQLAPPVPVSVVHMVKEAASAGGKVVHQHGRKAAVLGLLVSRKVERVAAEHHLSAGRYILLKASQHLPPAAALSHTSAPADHATISSLIAALGHTPHPKQEDGVQVLIGNEDNPVASSVQTPASAIGSNLANLKDHRGGHVGGGVRPQSAAAARGETETNPQTQGASNGVGGSLLPPGHRPHRSGSGTEGSGNPQTQGTSSSDGSSPPPGHQGHTSGDGQEGSGNPRSSSPGSVRGSSGSLLPPGQHGRKRGHAAHDSGGTTVTQGDGADGAVNGGPPSAGLPPGGDGGTVTSTQPGQQGSSQGDQTQSQHTFPPSSTTGSGTVVLPVQPGGQGSDGAGGAGQQTLPTGSIPGSGDAGQSSPPSGSRAGKITGLLPATVPLQPTLRHHGKGHGRSSQNGTASSKPRDGGQGGSGRAAHQRQQRRGDSQQGSGGGG